MITRARLAVLLSSVVLAASLVPVLPAAADDAPTPSPTPTVEVVTPTPDPTPAPRESVVPHSDVAASTYEGAGVVTIDNSTTPFVAVPAAWEVPGTTFAYRWYRGATSATATTPATGTGSATDHYTPNTADSHQFLRVVVTATVPGFTTKSVRPSDAKDYSIVTNDVVGIGGDPDDAPGSVVHVGSPASTYHVVATNMTVTPSIAYVWKRDGVVIAGEAGTSYTIRPTDPGHVISAALTLTAPGGSPTLFVSPNMPVPLLILPDQPVVHLAKTGTSTMTLTATLETDPAASAGRTVAWKWLRDGSPIAGATAASHVIVTADYGHTLTAVVTISKALYAPKTAQDSTSDFSLFVHSGGAASGTTAVGATLTADPVDFWTSGHVDPSSVTRQWLRNGTVVGTGATYRMVAADAGATLSLRTTGTFPEYLPAVSPVPLGVVAKALFSSATVSLGTPIASRITPTVSFTDPWPDLGAVTKKYQWYRDDVAIPGATGTSYLLTAADAHKQIGLIVTLTKPGYATAMPSDDGGFTLEAYGIVFLLGDFAVGTPMGVGLPGAFLLDNAVVDPDLSFQWLRDGHPIAGDDGDGGYTPGPADLNHSISVRVTASVPGYPVVVLTSDSTEKLGNFAFQDNSAPVQVLHAGTPGVLTTGATGITSVPGTVTTYQWFRGNVAIAGATHISYTLTSADVGTTTAVHIRVTNPGYTPYSKVSSSIDYSLTAATLPTTTANPAGLFRVGDQLTVNPPAYKDGNHSAIVPATTYQWLRNGVAIASATGTQYTLQPADFGAKLAARVVGNADGWNTITQVTAPTPVIGTGVLVVAPNQPEVTDTDRLLQLSLPAGTVSTPGVTYAYQWFRQTGSATPVAIGGATLDHYLLTAADLDKKVNVRVIVSKLHAAPASVTLPLSTPVDYSIKPLAPAVVNGVNKVGNELTAIDGTYQSALGNPLFPSNSVQWYRSGVAIPGQTSVFYTLTAADLSKAITARFTETANGYLPRVVTASPTPAVTAAGILTDGSDPVMPSIVLGTLPGQLQLHIDGHFDQPGVIYAVQWKRNGANISGATKATFTLASTDANNLISYVLTASKSGYASTTRSATAHRFGIVTNTLIPIYGDGRVGGLVQVRYDLGSWNWQYSETGTPVTPTLKYQWYRGTLTVRTAIPGATSSSYIPIAADYNNRLSVRVYASGPGIVPTSSLSGLTNPPSGLGVNSDDGTALTSLNATTDTLSATLGSLLPAVPAPVITYQWYRRPGAQAEQIIPGATKSTYKLAAGDLNRSVWVRITVHRANFTTTDGDPATGGGANDSLYYVDSEPYYPTAFADAMPAFAATPMFGVPLVAPHPTYHDSDVNPIPGTPKYTYIWYRNTSASTSGGVAIAGATGATYTPIASDVGKFLFVVVSAKFPGYVTSVGSASPVSAQVLAANLGHVGLNVPTISIANSTTMQLKVTYSTVGQFTVAPTSVTYEWLRNNSTIAGATASTYTLTQADFGYPIRVILKLHKPGYVDAYEFSNIVNYSMSLTTPSLTWSGPLATDTVVTVTPPTASPVVAGTVITYQWYRENPTTHVVTKLTGQTHVTYRVVPADVNQYIYVKAHAAKAGYLTQTSVAAAPISPTLAAYAGTYPSPVPTANGHVISSNFNEHNITTPGVTYKYQWSHDDIVIAGATKTTYTIPGSPIGKYTVTVTVTKPGYSTLTLQGSKTIF